MKYANLNGTTEPSFKLGPRGLSLSYGDVIEGQEVIERYRLKVTEPNGIQHNVAYDTEIPVQYVVNIDSESNAEEGITTIIIQNSNGTESTIRIASNAGGVKTVSESTVFGNLATFASTDGTLIQDSGVGITNDIENDSGNNLPTAQAVKDYLGVISGSIASVLEGSYYIIKPDENGNLKHYQVYYDKASQQYVYIEKNI